MDDREQRKLNDRIDDLERTVKKLIKRLDRVDPEGRAEKTEEGSGGFWTY